MNILHGKGDQYWMTKKYEEDRKKAKLDRNDFTDAELETLGITDTATGGGSTHPDSFTLKQYPFPEDTTIKRKKEIDIREVDPTIGGD